MLRKIEVQLLEKAATKEPRFPRAPSYVELLKISIIKQDLGNLVRKARELEGLKPSIYKLTLII
jgi:hypothetical protein